MKPYILIHLVFKYKKLCPPKHLHLLALFNKIHDQQHSIKLEGVATMFYKDIDMKIFFLQTTYASAQCKHQHLQQHNFCK
jgi:hypothetical protein